MQDLCHQQTCLSTKLRPWNLERQNYLVPAPRRRRHDDVHRRMDVEVLRIDSAPNLALHPKP